MTKNFENICIKSKYSLLPIVLVRIAGPWAKNLIKIYSRICLERLEKTIECTGKAVSRADI